MKRASVLAMIMCAVVLVGGPAGADSHQEELIASAISAAPPVITDHATIKTMDGEVLREGSNDWTCYAANEMIGPMCNQAPWDALLAALLSQQPFDSKDFSVSYMLAGEGSAPGSSNIDPFATAPTPDNQWVKEGPHLMITVPDPAMLEGISTDPADPVYVMWKGTPYAHIMVKIAPEE